MTIILRKKLKYLHGIHSVIKFEEGISKKINFKFLNEEHK